jgi:hypothetical protein
VNASFYGLAAKKSLQPWETNSLVFALEPAGIPTAKTLYLPSKLVAARHIPGRHDCELKCDDVSPLYTATLQLLLGYMSFRNPYTLLSTCWLV